MGECGKNRQSAMPCVCENPRDLRDPYVLCTHRLSVTGNQLNIFITDYSTAHSYFYNGLIKVICSH